MSSSNPEHQTTAAIRCSEWPRCGCGGQPCKRPSSTISPLEIEATILGLKACEEHSASESDRANCRRAMRLIRTMQASLKGTLAVAQVNRDVAELARGVQIAHAAWVAMGSPGAWSETDAE